MKVARLGALIAALVIAALVAVLVVSIAGRIPGPLPTERQGLRDLLGALPHPRVAGGLALVSLPAFCVGVLFVLAPLSLDKGGFGPFGITATFICASAILGVASPTVGRRIDRRGRRGLVSASLVAATCPATVLADTGLTIRKVLLATRRGRLNSADAWAMSSTLPDWSGSRRWMLTARMALASAVMAPPSARAICPFGRMTTTSRPAAAPYAAAEAEVLPVEAQMIACAPSSTALLTAATIPRSLNEPVGFIPSSLR